MNPLIPGAGDIALASLVIVNTILVIAALIMLARSTNRPHVVSTVLLILLVPVVGPIVASVAIRRRRGTATSAERAA